jgi:hypothetical protein
MGGRDGYGKPSGGKSNAVPFSSHLFLKKNKKNQDFLHTLRMPREAVREVCAWRCRIGLERGDLCRLMRISKSGSSPDWYKFSQLFAPKAGFVMRAEGSIRDMKIVRRMTNPAFGGVRVRLLRRPV